MRIIAGSFKNRLLNAPKSGQQTRPTSAKMRGAVFNICQQEIVGARFLDLFAGTGAMGLEALSRQARAVTFVESQRSALTSLQKNRAALGVSECSIVYGMDVFCALKELISHQAQFDLIYADPPYGTELTDQLISFLDKNPLLLAAGGTLFLEEARPYRADLLNHLKLLRCRKMGASYLHQFIIG